jgi:hypothetical protein
MELMDFVKILARDMLENKQSTTPPSQSAFSIMDTTPPPTAIFLSRKENGENDDSATKLSSFSSATSSSRITENVEVCKHTLAINNDFTSHVRNEGDQRLEGKRRRRGKCMVCGRNTTFYCITCPPSAKRQKAWCCNDSAGRSGERSCLRTHQEEVENLSKYN